MKKLLWQVSVGNRPHFEFSHRTWSWWAAKYGFQYIVHRPDMQQPMWRKFDCKEMLQQYECTLIVDDDTMVSWQCPDFTEGLNGAIAGAPDTGHMGCVTRYCRLGFERFGGEFINPWEYINTGVVVWPKDGKPAMEEVLNAGVPHTGLAPGDWEQTTVNYIARRHKFALLDQRYNFSQPALHRIRNLWQLPMLGHVWHFNDPDRNKHRLPYMTRCWELFGKEYK